MQLVIVESPTKSRTLKGFLGPGYDVQASFGHVRDLPKSRLAIDIENDFRPEYSIIPKAKKTISFLKEKIKKNKNVILATDEDREGEAIAWHLSFALGLKNPQRIVFHEITKTAIEEALKNPRQIDMNLVDAQQVRRILDRLVGYKLSPFLWYKVAKGLSAGRVQSVAVRLVADREREIEKFITQEYWTIEALLSQQVKTEKDQKEFLATLIKKDNKTIDKLDIKTKEEADKIVKNLEGAEYKVISIERKETKKNPLPPFATSTLQQTAWQKLKYPAKMTMSLAQALYENGFITYHRTDSLNLSEQSLSTAQRFIEENYGKKYCAGSLRKFKTKSKGAQEAHEAIRPTDPNNTPEKISSPIDKRQLKLYDLIWRRFVASQMSQAIFDSTVVDIKAENYTFRSNGSIMKFDGFLKVYPIKFSENDLPHLEKEEVLNLIKLIHSQHFTQPPARYNEATLVKKLEELGIGRPSTYAPIISTIQSRRYVEKNEEKRFIPTQMGTTVNDLLVEHFPKIVDYQFTAKMEEELDEIAEGKIKWVPVIKEFFEPFIKNLDEKYKQVEKIKQEEETNRICPDCGGQLVIRTSRYGRFFACKNYPKCRFLEPINNSTNVVCPKCNKGEIVERQTKKGKIFYSCSKYPECDFALWDSPINEKCPKCDSLLVKTRQNKVKCSNKECDFV